LKSYLILCFSIILCQQGFAQTVEKPQSITPSPYYAEYEATWKSGWFPITIEAERELTQKEDGTWQLTFEAYSSIADLHEASQYEIHNNIIKPLTYRYKTSGFLSKKKRGQIFDWEEEKVFISEKDQWADYRLELGFQDNLSYQDQIRLDLMTGKTEFEYQVAYKNRLKTLIFKVDNYGEIKTRDGHIKTVEIIELNKKRKASTRIWFAVDYDYLLIKLKNKESNGDSNTIKLKKAHINGQPLIGF